MPRDYALLTSGVICHPRRARDKDMASHIEKFLNCILRRHPCSAIMLMGNFNRMEDTPLKSSLHLKQIVRSATRGDNVLDKMCIDADFWVLDHTKK